MIDIDKTALRRLDLTVLLVFVAMLKHRKAVAVATEMGLTQSAISHSLARLRAVFDDPLFLRKPHGMEPTAVALALEPAIRLAVETLDTALRPPVPFEPEKAEATVRIAAYDNEIVTMVPQLLARLGAAAPGLRLAVHALGRKPAVAALDTGEIDLAAGFFWELPASATATQLYEQGYRVVARRDHPQARASFDLDTFLDCRHLVVSPTGDLQGIVDDVLATQGLQRRVSAALPQFMPALEAVAASDLIATLPARLVDLYAGRFNLNVFEPPLVLRPIAISAVIHKRNAASPLHEWLVSQFRQLFA